MIFKLEIDCANDSFKGGVFNEVARILEHQAKSLRSWNDGDPAPQWGMSLSDVNGNPVGMAQMVVDPT